MSKRWKWFSRSEFTCKCGCGGNEIQDDFIDRLDQLREKLGFRLRITSGYRCPSHNLQVASSGATGPHTTGRAADIAVDRERAYELVAWAEACGFTGIGLNQKGPSRFIHLDDLPHASGRPRPTVWTY
jgi:zinc D-Ala-D-Ala carboxypeptidase